MISFHKSRVVRVEVLWLVNEWNTGRKPACICFATIRSDHIRSHPVQQECPFCCLQRAAADLECPFRVRESDNRGMASLAIMVPLGFKYDQSVVRCKDQSIISVAKRQPTCRHCRLVAGLPRLARRPTTSWRRSQRPRATSQPTRGSAPTIGAATTSTSPGGDAPSENPSAPKVYLTVALDNGIPK